MAGTELGVTKAEMKKDTKNTDTNMWDHLFTFLTALSAKKFPPLLQIPLPLWKK